MICELVLTITAYNVDLNKVEKVKFFECTKNHKEIMITKPRNRECGFNLINGKKYFYCFIRKEK
jgi:hypothetical protein